MIKIYKAENVIKTEPIEIEFDKKYDVAVIGLGTAGAFALISSARNQLKTIGVEQTNYLGGVGTGGGIHSYYYGSAGGLQAEIDKEVFDLSEQLVQKHVKGFHPEAKKYVLEKKAREAGADISFNSLVLAVYKKGDTVVGFQTKTPQGILNIQTQMVIDCSGEGDFCILAGAEYRYGREFNGEAQPYSCPRTYVSKEGKIHGANFDAGYVDTKDISDISRAIIQGHSLHLREKFTREDRYVCLSPLLGVREGRFIVGEAQLSFEEVIYSKTIEKPLMEFYSHHDTHSNDFAFESQRMQDWVLVCGLWSKDISGAVPLGAFVPKGLKGVLVAGRCMSMDHDISQSFRMQRDMQKTGEIASILAKHCILNNKDAMELDYNSLKTELLEKGLYPKKWLQLCKPIVEKNEVEKSFLECANGFAIWSCQFMDNAIESTLIEWLGFENANIRNCAAFALALRGNISCLPLLRKMVLEREKQTFKDAGKSRPFYIIAIYLLAKLLDYDSLALIKNVLLSSDVKSFEDVSYSLMALKTMSQINTPYQIGIKQFLHELIKNYQVQLPLTLQGNNQGLYKTVLNRGELVNHLLFN